MKPIPYPPRQSEERRAKSGLIAALLIFSTLLSPLYAVAQTTSVSFPLNTLFGGAAYNKPLTITAQNSLISDGVNLWAGTYTIVPASATNPTVSLYPNTYLLTVPGVVKATRFTVPVSTNTLDVTTLITSGPLFYFGTNGMINLWPGSGIVFTTNADGSITMSSAGATPNIGAGTNVVLTTNAGVIYVNTLNITNASPIQASGLVGTLPLSVFPGQVITNTYNLKSYGAFGDAQVANHAYATSNSPIVYVGLGQFTTNDIGKYALVDGAGPNRTMFSTGISNVYSPTSIMLSNAVPMSYNAVFPDPNIASFPYGFPIIYGAHDDSGAAQTWLNQITNGGGIFDADAGIYLILTNVTAPNYAQLIVPVPGWNAPITNQMRNNTPWMFIRGRPSAKPGFYSNPGELFFNPGATIFVSNLQGGNGPAQCGTNLIGNSFIDFRAYNYGNALTTSGGSVPPANNNFAGQYYWPINLVNPSFQYITILMGYDCNAVALNLVGAEESEGDHVNVLGGSFLNTCAPPLQGTNGWGIILPGAYSGVGSTWNNNIVMGFYNCMDLGLGFGDYNTFSTASNGFTCVFGDGVKDASRFTRQQMNMVNNWVMGSGQVYRTLGGASPKIEVCNYSSTYAGAGTPAWQTNIWAVNDPSNYLCNVAVGLAAGYVRYSTSPQSGNPPNINQGVYGSPGVDAKNFFVIQDAGTTNVDNFNKQFNGTVLFTGTTSSSNLTVMGNGAFNVMGYQQIGIGNAGSLGLDITGGNDSIYMQFQGNGNGGRTSSWVAGDDDALLDIYPQADFMFIPYNLSGSGTVSGFYNKGVSVMFTTNGDLWDWGTMHAGNNVVATNGIISLGAGFTGLAAGLTNADGSPLLDGKNATNSFDATNAAWNALKTATNSFDATNAAFNALITATNSFDPTNAAQHATNNLFPGAFSTFGVFTNSVSGGGQNTNVLIVAGFGTAAINSTYTNVGAVELNGAYWRLVYTNMLNNGLFFWAVTNTSPYQWWVGTNVATEAAYGTTAAGAPTNMSLWTTSGGYGVNPIGTITYGTFGLTYTNQLPAGQLFFVGRTNIAVTASNNYLFFDTPITNGAPAAAAFGNGTANNTIQTNLNLFGATNFVLGMANNGVPTTTFAENSLLGFFISTNNGGTFTPLASIDQDFGYPGIDGCLKAWGGTPPSQASGSMVNAGRFLGDYWPWQLQYGSGTDTRTVIMKGEAAAAGTSGGSVYMVEVHAATGTPGSHGTFNNSLLIATNGAVAIGDGTDQADQNQNTWAPPFWLTVYGDGSWWARENAGQVKADSQYSQPGGNASVMAPFGIMGQSLIPLPMPGAIEPNGTNVYWTDNSTNRWRLAMQNTNGLFLGTGTRATNACVFSTGGITNTLSINLLVEGFTGTTVVKSNSAFGSAYTLGTISTATTEILQPGEMLYGSSCACVTNRAW